MYGDSWEQNALRHEAPIQIRFAVEYTQMKYMKTYVYFEQFLLSPIENIS